LVYIGVFLPCRRLHTDELRKIKKGIWIFLSKKRLKPAPFLGYELSSLLKRHLSLFILYNRRPTDHWSVFPLGIIRGNKHHLVKKQQQQNFLFFDQNIKFDFYLCSGVKTRNQPMRVKTMRCQNQHMRALRSVRKWKKRTKGQLRVRG